MEFKIRAGRIAHGICGNTITNEIWKQCDRLTTKPGSHIELNDVPESDVGAVRSAVYRYRKESGELIFLTLKKAAGKKYAGFIQYEQGT